VAERALRLIAMAMWIWFAAAGVLLLVEIITADLLFASLAISALAATGAAALGADIAVQGLVFGIAAAISLLLLRPVALKHLRKQPRNGATNTDALLGAEAVTLTEVTEFAGQIKLAGEVWSAKTEGAAIAAERKVLVTAIRGATAIIKEA
jgi:membrane protein implicated in regulation of membrane protease activity